ncbi:uncharacterized protein LOC132926819 [Rhopalosiphum padi]|uniref:uncharacterized protein LOC132926819 n=1 Tax=Rhopalosiphum padi TaxID=40932 RepID=UPI00298ED009|nr:uncharacterized protein LOC132926819 [Rhopalosiphum padi]
MKPRVFGPSPCYLSCRSCQHHTPTEDLLESKKWINNKSIFDKIKFIIVDFEFTMIHRIDLLLVSGSMADNEENFIPIKLAGRPLVLTKNKIEILKNHEVAPLKKQLIKIFKNKTNILNPILEQLQLSLEIKKGSNLSPTFMNNYLQSDNREPIIVLWNGTTDKEIINRLKLNMKKILNITSYSDNNDSYLI